MGDVAHDAMCATDSGHPIAEEESHRIGGAAIRVVRRGERRVPQTGRQEERRGLVPIASSIEAGLGGDLEVARDHVHLAAPLEESDDPAGPLAIHRLEPTKGV